MNFITFSSLNIYYFNKNKNFTNFLSNYSPFLSYFQFEIISGISLLNTHAIKA